MVTATAAEPPAVQDEASCVDQPAVTSVVGSTAEDRLISAILTVESASLAEASVENVTTMDDLVAIDTLRHRKFSETQKPVESAAQP